MLGERNFFVLSESGQLRYERRLDFIPTAMCPYYFEQAPNRMNVLLASSTGNLMVLDMNKVGFEWTLFFEEVLLGGGGGVSPLTTVLKHKPSPPENQVPSPLPKTPLKISSKNDSHKKSLFLLPLSRTRINSLLAKGFRPPFNHPRNT